MKVWDGISDARIVFNADDLGLGEQGGQLARLMENLNLQRALLRHLRSHGGVDIYDNVKVTSIAREVPEEPMSWPTVHLSNGRAIRTRLLVKIPFPFFDSLTPTVF
jgi:ubiquinone biosynthesis monooxygenase Coq6